jgi:melibiose permease/lactose/raffinose/galactose permease
MAMLIMLTNTIEYDEWKNGERNEAVTFSVRPFMVKLSGAIQTGIVSLTLIACGLYNLTQNIGKLEIQKGQELIDDAKLIQDANEILNQATPNQEFFLSIAMTIIPVLMFIATYFIIKKKYIIDEDMYEKMTKEIEERKQNK